VRWVGCCPSVFRTIAIRSMRASGVGCLPDRQLNPDIHPHGHRTFPRDGGLWVAGDPLGLDAGGVAGSPAGQGGTPPRRCLWWAGWPRNRLSATSEAMFSTGPRPPNSVAGQRLSSKDSRIVERVLEMEGGYLLDLNHRRLTQLIADFNIDFDDHKYLDLGPSKANKFRSFLRQNGPPLVGRVLSALLEHRLENPASAALPDDVIDDYREIAARFGSGASSAPIERTSTIELDPSADSEPHEHVYGAEAAETISIHVKDASLSTAGPTKAGLESTPPATPLKDEPAVKTLTQKCLS
jgi:hypothetical protein